MKLITVLPLAALSVAFVVPAQNVMSQIAIESHQSSSSVLNSLPTKDRILNEAETTFSKVAKCSKTAIDNAIEHAADAGHDFSRKLEETTKSWLDSEHTDFFRLRGKDHHGHHGQKPNLTVYELIAKSEYTTKLAELINDYPDLVELLNGTAANYTVFAPIDKAFEGIPEDAPKPSKETIKNILQYHVSSEFYPAGRVLTTHTVPSSYAEESLGGKLQRLSTNIGIGGLTVNFYSRIIAIDIFGTNGVIHAVDHILVPPPKAAEIIQILPGEFSTLELALTKTGLLEHLNDTTTHVGGTLFAPSNFAFQILGPRVNAFLFSSYGQKYLKALLLYHVVPNNTLYSDAFYKAENVEGTGIPKGVFHVDLHTALKEKSLSIDIFRFGRIISIKINGFSQVTIEDGIAKDGVIQVLGNVLIPPKQIAGVEQQWQGEEMSVEDLMERLEPLVEREEL
ncbi:hypothetical protein MMC07_001546 [Pseudocyphellaria aurata]|nr:hypothetical protein [Pseudocyphellaria aurata]